MSNFKNKIAFVTGAASGIGLAITKNLTAQGAKVMMADLSQADLETQAFLLRENGADVESVQCDVRDATSVQSAANATIDAFGKVHMVFNNAGVSLAGRTGDTALEDWRWIVDINLMGVVYGVEIFTPLLKSHGEGGYIVNTASMAGHFTMPQLGPYHATKFAVVGYSEALAQELATENISVTVLCPTWVQSNIVDSGKDKPSGHFGTDEKSSAMYQVTKSLVENGMPAATFAEVALKAVAQKQLYAFNDPEARNAIDTRSRAILKDYDACLNHIETLS